MGEFSRMWAVLGRMGTAWLTLHMLILVGILNTNSRVLKYN